MQLPSALRCGSEAVQPTVVAGTACQASQRMFVSLQSALQYGKCAVQHVIGRGQLHVSPAYKSFTQPTSALRQVSVQYCPFQVRHKAHG